MRTLRTILLTLAVGLGLTACAGGPDPVTEPPKPPTPPAVDRPNVLLLFADDMRPDAFGAAGNPHIATPAIDGLAARGFRFSQNYCMGSIHGAVCQPSRAMLLSGRTLYHVPMNLEDVPSLPEVLRENGYATFATGKWHNGGDSFLRCFDRGQAVFLGGMSDHTAVPLRDVGPERTFVNERTGDGFSSEIFADAAIEFLEAQPNDEPFFAYVSFTAPHDPRQPPLPYRERYYENRPPLPDNYMPQHPFHNGWMTGRDEKLAGWPRTKDVISDQLAEYYGMITHLDDQVGRILSALEASGHADRTIVIFTADHGLAMGSHGLLGKQSVYEHSMGCPLVVAGPGVPPADSSSALTYLYDLFPTICDVTGTDVPDGVEGESLRPVYAGEQATVRDSLFVTYENKMRAVRDERYKLIRYPLIDYVQLFDLYSDPSELHNLASEPGQSERVARMTELMEAWRARTDDPHPLHVDEPQSMEIDLTGRARKPDRWQPDWIVEKYFDEADATDK